MAAAETASAPPVYVDHNTESNSVLADDVSHLLLEVPERIRYTLVHADLQSMSASVSSTRLVQLCYRNYARILLGDESKDLVEMKGVQSRAASFMSTERYVLKLMQYDSVTYLMREGAMSLRVSSSVHQHGVLCSVVMRTPDYKSAVGIYAMHRASSCLREYVKKNKPYDFMRIVHGVCAGVYELRGIGMVHLDVKPSNYFFDRDSQCVKLADHELAVRNATSRGSAYVVTRCYRDPVLCLYGSRPGLCSETSDRYHAPVDARFDEWSVACTVVFMVFGNYLTCKSIHEAEQHQRSDDAEDESVLNTLQLNLYAAVMCPSPPPDDPFWVPFPHVPAAHREKWHHRPNHPHLLQRLTRMLGKPIIPERTADVVCRVLSNTLLRSWKPERRRGVEAFYNGLLRHMGGPLLLRPAPVTDPWETMHGSGFRAYMRRFMSQECILDAWQRATDYVEAYVMRGRHESTVPERFDAYEHRDAVCRVVDLYFKSMYVASTIGIYSSPRIFRACVSIGCRMQWNWFTENEMFLSMYGQYATKCQRDEQSRYYVLVSELMRGNAMTDTQHDRTPDASTTDELVQNLMENWTMNMEDGEIAE